MATDNRIYYKQIGTDKWFLLHGFSKMSDAIAYARESNYMGLGYIGLATYQQMQLNNCEWDNL